MKRVSLAALLLASACSMKPPTGPVAGKAYFAQVGCLTCHRVGSEGGATGPDLTMVGFRHSADWLDLWIKDPQAWKPTTVMPNKQLSPAARAAIVSYLVALKGQDWPQGGRPWDGQEGAARGRLVFLRAGCIACHGAGGSGGQPNNNVKGGRIPALNNIVHTYTKDELVKRIGGGVAASQKEDPSGPDPLVRMPKWADALSPQDVDAVATYLLTLKADEATKTDW
ncbi:MAG: cytochrome c [Elusimicrobia bacterium]|nr:cytochrome c [Elusimicrobiota bacterium]